MHGTHSMAYIPSQPTSALTHTGPHWNLATSASCSILQSCPLSIDLFYSPSIIRLAGPRSSRATDACCWRQRRTQHSRVPSHHITSCVHHIASSKLVRVQSSSLTIVFGGARAGPRSSRATSACCWKRRCGARSTTIPAWRSFQGAWGGLFVAHHDIPPAVPQGRYTTTHTHTHTHIIGSRQAWWETVQSPGTG